MNGVLGFDRTATWSEICHALSIESEEEYGGTRQRDDTLPCDLSAIISALTEEFAWLTLAEQILGLNVN